AAAVPAVFFMLQLAAMVFNEVAFKGKSLGVALRVLPACLLYNLVKTWSLFRTLARIFLGKEPELARAKAQWRERRSAPAPEAMG
ncbi:MAG: hypothetical protein MI919_12855, partial [Holophagales bacterium]|nr:hypothetical protein [Holophagales bacterium]